jgi:hypothetical protein
MIDDLRHGRSNIAPQMDVDEAMQGAYAMYLSLCTDNQNNQKAHL